MFKTHAALDRMRDMILAPQASFRPSLFVKATALIEVHRGTIGATSKEGEGSTFWFRIPIGAHHLPCDLDGATLKFNEPIN